MVSLRKALLLYAATVLFSIILERVSKMVPENTEYITSKCYLCVHYVEPA